MREGERHKKAKAKLAKWLRDAASRQDWGLTAEDRTFVEPWLSFAPFSTAIVPWWEKWDKSIAPSRKTIYNICNAQSARRFDVAVVRGSNFLVAFEVKSYFGVSLLKANELDDLPFQTIELCADWINANRHRPDNWDEGILEQYGDLS